MARIRTIKPEFWSNPKVVNCSLRARLLFIGLWNFSDDSGRAHDDPRQIKMLIFPGDDVTALEVHELLTELSVNLLIQRYSIEGKHFIQVRGWHHQKINRPNESKIPPPNDQQSLIPHGLFTEQTLPEGKGREKEKEKEKEGSRQLTRAREDANKPPNAGCLSQEDQELVTRMRSVGDRVIGIAGMRDYFGDFQVIAGWLRSGCSPELDVYPTIERIAARKGYQPPRGPGFFTKAVQEARSKRESGEAPHQHSNGSAAEHQPQAVTDGTWHKRVRYWIERKDWLVFWGPEPDQMANDVPKAVLDAYPVETWPRKPRWWVLEQAGSKDPESARIAAVGG